MKHIPTLALISFFAISCQKDLTTTQNPSVEQNTQTNEAVFAAPSNAAATPANTPSTSAAAKGVVGIEGIAAFDKLAKSDLDAIRKAHVFFGHQSVGGNVLNGAEALGFPFKNVSEASEYASATLGEGKVADNGNPDQKIRSFGSFLIDKHIGDKVDLAGFKFCWIDFGNNTAISSIEASYNLAIKNLKEKFPKLRMFHVTTPLTSNEVAENRVRVAFGNRLKERYGNDSIVFDLAAVQSTRDDGSRCTKNSVPMLCDEFKSDDGHLSEGGSKRAAKAFLYSIHRALHL